MMFPTSVTFFSLITHFSTFLVLNPMLHSPFPVVSRDVCLRGGCGDLAQNVTLHIYISFHLTGFLEVAGCRKMTTVS